MASADVLTNTFANANTPEPFANHSKRKRDESIEGENYTNGTQEASDNATSPQTEDEFIRDLLDVLKV